MTIQVLNGANLARLGTREPDKYGVTTYAQLVEVVEKTGHELQMDVRVRQTDAAKSNSELVDAFRQNAGQPERGRKYPCRRPRLIWCGASRSPVAARRENKYFVTPETTLGQGGRPAGLPAPAPARRAGGVNPLLAGQQGVDTPARHG